MTTPTRLAVTLELATVRPHLAIDMPSSALQDSLRQRLDSLWMRAGNKAQAEESLSHLAGFDHLGAALLSPPAVQALVRLHKLGVIDLRDCQSWAHGRDMNAVDLLLDFAPSQGALASWNCEPAAPESLLRPLVEAGISVRGHPDASLPPLASALDRPDANEWVATLLNLGADPLQPCSKAHELLGERIGRPTLSCLTMATQKGLHELEALMTRALMPAAGQALDESTVLGLFKCAIKNDSTVLFERLTNDAGSHAKNVIGKAFQRFGREIGPALATHLIHSHTAAECLATQCHGLGEKLERVASEVADSAALSRAVIVYGLSRMVESGDLQRLGVVRDHLVGHPHSLKATARLLGANHPAEVGDMVRVLQQFETIAHIRDGGRLGEFTRIWANAHPSLSSLSEVQGGTVRLRGDQMRWEFHEALQGVFGSRYESIVSPRIITHTEHGPQRETADDALLRALDEALQIAANATVARARIERCFDAPAADQTLSPALRSALEDASKRTRGEIFNALLSHAAQRGFAKAMLALLPPIAAQQHNAGLHIENPQAIFGAVAKLSSTDRTQVAKRLCQYIADDPGAPVSLATLLGQIDQFLPPARPIDREQLSTTAVLTALSGGVSAFLTTRVVKHAREVAAFKAFAEAQWDEGDVAPWVKNPEVWADAQRLIQSTVRSAATASLKLTSTGAGLSYVITALGAGVSTATLLRAFVNERAIAAYRTLLENEMTARLE